MCFFSAPVDQSTPDRKDLDLLSDAHAEASRHQRLTIEKGHIGLGWDAGDDELRQTAWPVARDALDLATSGPLDRLKRCPEELGGCAWLFIDGSKNGSRRWCSMQDCDSRVKSRRQNQRLRTEP